MIGMFDQYLQRISDAIDRRKMYGFSPLSLSLSRSDRKWNERGLHISRVNFHLFLSRVFSCRGGGRTILGTFHLHQSADYWRPNVKWRAEDTAGEMDRLLLRQVGVLMLTKKSCIRASMLYMRRGVCLFLSLTHTLSLGRDRSSCVQLNKYFSWTSMTWLSEHMMFLIVSNCTDRRR